MSDQFLLTYGDVALQVDGDNAVDVVYMDFSKTFCQTRYYAPEASGGEVFIANLVVGFLTGHFIFVSVGWRDSEVSLHCVGFRKVAFWFFFFRRTI